MLKYILLLATLLLLLVTKEAIATEKLTIVLDWFVNPNHAPIIIAKEQGFFKRHGLEVAIIQPADPSDPPKWIAMNKGDLALDYQPHYILQRARGLPVTEVGTLIDRPLNCLVVLASSSINQLQDLRGKRVAYSAPEVDLIILKAMLHKARLSLNDITPVNVHYDLTQALLSKKVAAAIGMMRNVELLQLKLLGEPGRAFYPENYGVPEYSELVFIAAKNSTKKNLHPAFFAALNEAGAYLKQYPESCWRLFAASRPELNNPLNKAVWFETLKTFPNNFAIIDISQEERLARFLLQNSSLMRNQVIEPQKG